MRTIGQIRIKKLKLSFKQTEIIYHSINPFLRLFLPANLRSKRTTSEITYKNQSDGFEAFMVRIKTNSQRVI